MYTINHNLPDVLKALDKKAQVLEPASLARLGVASGKVVALKLEANFRVRKTLYSHN